MFKIETTLAALLFLSVAGASAQDPNLILVTPKTKLEQFVARTGIVLIKASAEIGVAQAEEGALQIRLKEYTEAHSRTTEYGISIGLKGNNRDETTFIDADELDAFLAAVDYISNVNTTITTLPYFDASYMTRGELKLSAHYSKREGTIKATIRSGYPGTGGVSLTMAQLAHFRLLIDESRRKLAEVRASR